MISTLDTHELVKDLKASGVTDAQAEAVTRAVRQAQDLSDLATKSDLAALRADIREEIGEVRAEFRAEIGGAGGEIGAARGGLAAPGLRLIKWVVGVGIVEALLAGGMIWAATQVLLRALPHV